MTKQYALARAVKEAKQGISRRVVVRALTPFQDDTYYMVMTPDDPRIRQVGGIITHEVSPTGGVQETKLGALFDS